MAYLLETKIQNGSLQGVAPNKHLVSFSVQLLRTNVENG